VPKAPRDAAAPYYAQPAPRVVMQPRNHGAYGQQGGPGNFEIQTHLSDRNQAESMAAAEQRRRANNPPCKNCW